MLDASPYPQRLIVSSKLHRPVYLLSGEPRDDRAVEPGACMALESRHLSPPTYQKAQTELVCHTETW